VQRLGSTWWSAGWGGWMEMGTGFRVKGSVGAMRTRPESDNGSYYTARFSNGGPEGLELNPFEADQANFKPSAKHAGRSGRDSGRGSRAL